MPNIPTIHCCIASAAAGATECVYCNSKIVVVNGVETCDCLNHETWRDR